MQTPSLMKVFTSFYRDQVGITRQVGEVCEKHGVSIHSILQNPILLPVYLTLGIISTYFFGSTFVELFS